MIYTVTGPIEKEELGVTLSHEHLAWDYSDSWALYFYKIYDKEKTEHLFNKLLPIFNKLYKLGCRSIVEASPPRGGQNLKLMQWLSIKSGINIIPNTGMPFKKYVYDIHKNFNENELADRWIKDFEYGLDTINDVTIRPSHIKLLLGDEEDGGLSNVDKKILKAAVLASKATGVPIHCHLLKVKGAEEAFDILENEDFDFTKFLWAHAGNEGNFDIIARAISRGIWLGFDQIRPEYYFKFCFLLKEAIKYGYKDRIILSQDYDFYEEINASKDNNCTSLFTNFIPYCESNGISKEVIIEMLTKNPANFFDINDNKIGWGDIY